MSNSCRSHGHVTCLLSPTTQRDQVWRKTLPWQTVQWSCEQPQKGHWTEYSLDSAPDRHGGGSLWQHSSSEPVSPFQIREIFISTYEWMYGLYFGLGMGHVNTVVDSSPNQAQLSAQSAPLLTHTHCLSASFPSCTSATLHSLSLPT